MYLVLIETSGNQNYIFSTNKLRENIGASQLTYLAGTQWVLKAIATVTGVSGDFDDNKLSENLMSDTLNPPIESKTSNGVEIIIATSGKAILIVKDKNNAVKIIQYVTTKALKEAPGLEICGTIQEFNWESDKLGKVNQEIHKKLESVRSQKPSSHLRFLRLPIVDECSTSSFPASVIQNNPENESEVVSHVSKLKQDQRQKAFDRIKSLIADEPGRYVTEPIHPEKNYIDYLENHSDWLAVVHADGNGLGEIFLKFHEHIHADSAGDNRKYINNLKRFSLALDDCTLSAFRTALNKVPQLSHHEDEAWYIVPLVLGGDDLTVVCDGRYGLNFTYEFLKAFEEETKKPEHYQGIVAEVAEVALGVGKLSACAGVAIIKPHFPFSIAYELSEGLMQSAKTVKKKVTNPKNKPYPCSSLDFHVLYDSSNVDLRKIREKLVIKNSINSESRLYQRPYVVTEIAQLEEALGKEWATFHQWEELVRRVEVMTAKAKDEEGRRKLPSSQMHDLRSGLFLGQEGADARYMLIRDRYSDKGIKELEGDDESLFSLQEEDGKNIYITALLDAIEVAEFLDLKKSEDQATEFLDLEKGEDP